MKWIFLVVAVAAELLMWFSLGYTYDPIERLVEQIVFFAGLAIIAFVLFSPVLVESDLAQGDRSSINYEQYSIYALCGFIVAVFICLPVASVINSLIS